MSWTLNVPQCFPEDFDAAVDAAEVTGQDASIPAVAEAVAIARAALKAFAPLVTHPRVGGWASGHVLIEGQEGPNWYEGVTISVNGAD